MIRGKSVGTHFDLWSLGVMVFEFMVGRLPFGHGSTNNSQTFAEVIKADPDYGEDLLREAGGTTAKAFIGSLLQPIPRKRLGGGHLGMQELKEHAFFEGFDFEKLLARNVKVPYKPNED